MLLRFSIVITSYFTRNWRKANLNQMAVIQEPIPQKFIEVFKVNKALIFIVNLYVYL